MAQTLVSLMVHIGFSTKGRRPNIRPEVEPELYRYMAGTLKHLASPCLAIGGTENHVHLLVSQSKNIALVMKSDATPPGSNLIGALAFRGRCPRLLHIALSGRHEAGLTVAGTSGASAYFNAYSPLGLAPDVAAVFRSSEAVNTLLRSVIAAMPGSER